LVNKLNPISPGLISACLFKMNNFIFQQQYTSSIGLVQDEIILSALIDFVFCCRANIKYAVIMACRSE